MANWESNNPQGQYQGRANAYATLPRPLNQNQHRPTLSYLSQAGDLIQFDDHVTSSVSNTPAQTGTTPAASQAETHAVHAATPAGTNTTHDTTPEDTAEPDPFPTRGLPESVVREYEQYRGLTREEVWHQEVLERDDFIQSVQEWINMTMALPGLRRSDPTVRGVLDNMATMLKSVPPNLENRQRIPLTCQEEDQRRIDALRQQQPLEIPLYRPPAPRLVIPSYRPPTRAPTGRGSQAESLVPTDTQSIASTGSRATDMGSVRESFIIGSNTTQRRAPILENTFRPPSSQGQQARPPSSNGRATPGSAHGGPDSVTGGRTTPAGSSYGGQPQQGQNKQDDEDVDRTPRARTQQNTKTTNNTNSAPQNSSSASQSDNKRAQSQTDQHAKAPPKRVVLDNGVPLPVVDIKDVPQYKGYYQSEVRFPDGKYIPQPLPEPDNKESDTKAEAEVEIKIGAGETPELTPTNDQKQPQLGQSNQQQQQQNSNDNTWQLGLSRHAPRGGGEVRGRGRGGPVRGGGQVRGGAVRIAHPDRPDQQLYMGRDRRRGGAGGVGGGNQRSSHNNAWPNTQATSGGMETNESWKGTNTGTDNNAWTKDSDPWNQGGS